MKKTILLVMVNMTTLFSGGCGKSPEKELAQLKKAYGPSQDTNVGGDPYYNFSSFAGTVWKTKVEVAVAEFRRYTGAAETKLLAPDAFDSKDPS